MKSKVVALMKKGQLAYSKNKFDDARIMYERALKIEPGNPEVLYLLGSLDAEQAKYDDALLRLREAAVKLPNSPFVSANLGTVLRLLGKTEEAESAYRAALSVDPSLIAALHGMSNLLMDEYRLSEAEIYLKRLMELPGGLALGSTLIARALLETGDAESALGVINNAMGHAPFDKNLHSLYLMTSHYSLGLSESEIFCRHSVSGHLWDKPQNFPSSPPKKLPLRVGYVSPDFRFHPVGLLLEDVLCHHDKSRIFPVFYHKSTKSDAHTDKFRTAAGLWRSVAGLSATKLFNLIRQDKIDVLVDLSGHSALNSLEVFGMRAAPVQVSYLGYPGTTGLSTIDYAISDRFLDPGPESASFYTEKLWLLDRLSFACQTKPGMLPVKQLPGLSSGVLTFGSFNALKKINPEVMRVWAEILHKCESSKLIMQSVGLEDETVSESVFDEFNKLGIHRSRISLFGITDFETHLRLVSTCDVALDTFPWSGHMTTLNMLSQGVPVITAKGSTRAGRMTEAILRVSGMTSFIAETPERMVDVALELQQNLATLQAVRQTLLEGLNNQLTDCESLCSALEDAFIEMAEKKGILQR